MDSDLKFKVNQLPIKNTGTNFKIFSGLFIKRIFCFQKVFNLKLLGVFSIFHIVIIFLKMAGIFKTNTLELKWIIIALIQMCTAMHINCDNSVFIERPLPMENYGTHNGQVLWERLPDGNVKVYCLEASNDLRTGPIIRHPRN